MSIGPVEPVVKAVDPDVPSNSELTEKVHEHAPEPVQPPVVEQVPDVHKESDDEWKTAITEAVKTLGETVNVLSGVVNGSLTARDESVSKVPWTHRG
jgi:hypothetical protein